MSDKEANRLQRKIMKEIDRLRALPAESIEPKEHATMVRKALKEKFPNLKFSVRSSIFAGGSSVTVYSVPRFSIEPKSDLCKEVMTFVDQFDGWKSHLMDGGCNVGFEWNGKRYRGATFCSYNY